MTRRSRTIVNDVDEQGRPVAKWLWVCSECGIRASFFPNRVPPGWRLEGNDVEVDLAKCSECSYTQAEYEENE